MELIRKVRRLLTNGEIEGVEVVGRLMNYHKQKRRIVFQPSTSPDGDNLNFSITIDGYRYIVKGNKVILGEKVGSSGKGYNNIFQKTLHKIIGNYKNISWNIGGDRKSGEQTPQRGKNTIKEFYNILYDLFINYPIMLIDADTIQSLSIGHKDSHIIVKVEFKDNKIKKIQKFKKEFINQLKRKYNPMVWKFLNNLNLTINSVTFRLAKKDSAHVIPTTLPTAHKTTTTSPA